MADPDTLARWRASFQELYDTIMEGRAQQFEAWFAETVLLRGRYELKKRALFNPAAGLRALKASCGIARRLGRHPERFHPW